MIRKAPISMIMTQDVITLKQTDSLETAEKLFKKNKIRHIPVVDDSEIIGMLSYSDLLRLSFADVTIGDDSSADAMVYNMLTTGQVMKRSIVTVSSSKSIKEVAEILATKEFHALPVVNNNILIGIVTTTDLINYLIKQF
ncbi:MAG: CBS domain-containing protein [Algibacter sp.]|uniref:CBS domain-containing protein n=1 Tax=Algibacter sp. TaxID=1872428 RepID=UPI0026068517|nr:CBS domain-containing protein [Algibacter sp.]MDG1730634.1 CBS domain-containing protein [Algibacter sp.]MDG2177455.1 CBS domain-containing protein [Algibacter sp.]